LGKSKVDRFEEWLKKKKKTLTCTEWLKLKSRRRASTAAKEKNGGKRGKKKKKKVAFILKSGVQNAGTQKCALWRGRAGVGGERGRGAIFLRDGTLRRLGEGEPMHLVEMGFGRKNRCGTLMKAKKKKYKRARKCHEITA